MNLRYVASCGLLCAALLLTGCDEGRKNPPDVTVRVANVAPTFQELGFRREQSAVRAIAFNDAQENRWDADTYDFFIDERAVALNSTPRRWTFSRELSE